MKKTDFTLYKYKINLTGFTLIEVLLTIAIVLLVGAISAPFYMSFHSSSQIDVTAQELIQTLRRAELKALNNENDDNWSVAIGENDQVTLFKGSDYYIRDTSFDEEFDIPPNIEISGIPIVVYQKFSGNPSEIGTINITNQERTVNINLNSLGVIDY